MTDRNLELIEKMHEIGQTHNATVSQVALAWMLADPVITSPIIGPNKIEQLDDNLRALNIHMTPEEKETLEDLTAWDRE